MKKTASDEYRSTSHQRRRQAFQWHRSSAGLFQRSSFACFVRLWDKKIKTTNTNSTPI